MRGSGAFRDSRWGVLAVVATLLIAPACGPAERGPGVEAVSSSEYAATCTWDPTFGSEGCSQGEWWVEFSVRDTTTQSMRIEITTATATRTVNLTGRVAMSNGFVKFTGGPGGRLATGTLVRLHATRSAAAGGQTVTSGWFRYLQAQPAADCGPVCTPSCAAGACGVADGCGGTCGPCGAGLSCVNNSCQCVPTCGSNVCGSNGCGGSCGACASGQTCTGGQCVCTPSCAPGVCGGSDGCGGTCGCASGAVCTTAGACCVPNTNTCGPDGCGNDRAPCGACSWDPQFGSREVSAGNWWVEFSVNDTVGAMSVEVQGPPARTIALPSRVPLGGGYVKFTGSPGSMLANGALVRLKVTQTAAAGGRQAQSTWFGYLTGTPALDCAGACTPSCAPGACGVSDGCGGTCNGCTSGQSCVNNACVCVPQCGANVCGSDGCGGTCGTCASGQTCTGGQCVCTPSCAPGACGVSNGCGGTCNACTASQACVNNACVCVPQCGSNVCGSDGCGGTCGTCTGGTTCQSGQCTAGCVPSWDPKWSAGTDAWWGEVRVVGGGALAKAVAIENVATGAVHNLSYADGRWVGGITNLQPGTSVRLRATNALGATSRTLPFAYGPNAAPVTDACATTAATNQSCQPLARGMVTFTFDDSAQSHPDVAIPLLNRYGVKGTFFVVPQWHTWTAAAQLLATQGHEFADHGMTHATLTGLGAQQLDDELRLSKQWIETNIASPVDSFATPSAAFNDTVVAAAKRHFGSHRGGVEEFNSVGSDVFRLGSHFAYNTTTSQSVCDRIRQVAAEKSWEILTFHDITTAASSGQSFTLPATVLEAILVCATTTPGVDVVTQREGAARIRCASPP
ncbi:MAG: polysaccharide deacetylase family protein [Deltaproteobacteria bacterium]|nr:polysaccharide deacetylase family protein [Deltaproteobacteria bacterium]